MTTQPNQDDVAAFMEELDKQLAKVIVGAMERGNMYDGYVVSAEFNVEAAKVVDTYLPMLKDILQQSNRQLLDEVEAAGPADKDYQKLEKCWCCGQYQYSCACEDAFNQANAQWHQAIQAIRKRRGYE